MFPTPAHALDGLGELVCLPPGARVLDAGCGLGHGLNALQAALPLAQVHGVEWSWPLRAVAAWRCPKAVVTRGDMWAADWGHYDLVYLFQRPESMARAWEQARQQMHPGAWLVSLEFPVPGVAPSAELHKPGGKPVWLYRVNAPAAQPGRRHADNSRKAAAEPRAASGPTAPHQEQSPSGS
jgi:SAM-dependent methyltransferase